MDGDERLRLLYVAATRARDHLVVSCHHIKDKPSHGAEVFAGDGRRRACRRRHRTACRSTTPSGPRSHDAVAVAVAPRRAARRGRAATPGSPGDGRCWRRQPAGGSRRRRRSPPKPRAVVAEPRSPDECRPLTATSRRRRRVRRRRAMLLDRRAAATTRRPGAAGASRARPSGGRCTPRCSRRPRHDADARRDRGGRAREAGHRGPPGRRRHGGRDGPLGAALRRRCELAGRHPHHKELYVAAPIGGRVIEGYIDLLVETPEASSSSTTRPTRCARRPRSTPSSPATSSRARPTSSPSSTRPGCRVVDCRFVFCRPGGAIERAVADLDAGAPPGALGARSGPLRLPGAHLVGTVRRTSPTQLPRSLPPSHRSQVDAVHTLGVES